MAETILPVRHILYAHPASIGAVKWFLSDEIINIENNALPRPFRRFFIGPLATSSRIALVIPPTATPIFLINLDVASALITHSRHHLNKQTLEYQGKRIEPGGEEHQKATLSYAMDLRVNGLESQ